MTISLYFFVNSNLNGIISLSYNGLAEIKGVKLSSTYYVGYKNNAAGVEFEVELYQTYSMGVAIAMPCWENVSPDEFQISFCGLTGSKAKFKVRGTKSPQICIIAVGK